MEIKNLEEVFHLLKMKSNTENLLAYIKEHKDSTIVISAKSKDLPIDISTSTTRVLTMLLNFFMTWEKDLIPN